VLYIKKSDSKEELLNLNDLIGSSNNLVTQGTIFHASESRICFINDQKINYIDSGDTAVVEKNRIYITGRSNRQVKIHGRIVNLNLLENVS
jgi:hypothetical protein